MRLDAQVLDDAIRSGAYRLGRPNLRPVKCASCSVDCLPSQARRVHLARHAGRGVFLCVGACVPKRTGTERRTW